jgi:hypothetical protein
MSDAEKLGDLVATSGNDGNWNYSPYMLGLYNGLVLAYAMIARVDPIFRDPPSYWISESSLEPDPVTEPGA